MPSKPEKNRLRRMKNFCKVLCALLDIVHCNLQGIALKGKQEDISVSRINHSKFQELVKILADYSDDLRLKKKGKRTVRLILPDI